MARLINVEKLSSEEIHKLTAASANLMAAQDELKKVKDDTSKNHKMAPERWLEWHTEYEIDGHFILQYREDYIIMNK